MTPQLVTGAWPRDLLTLPDWEALEGDELHRYECVEGVLVVAPRPHSQHQRVIGNLVAALNRELPTHLEALGEAEVLLFEVPLTVRIPDVLVTAESVVRANPARLRASNLSVVVEVTSVGSRRTDRVMKRSEYAEAGIPAYWVIDLDPLTMSVQRLTGDGAYEVAGTYDTVADLEVVGVNVRLDLAALARR